MTRILKESVLVWLSVVAACYTILVPACSKPAGGSKNAVGYMVSGKVTDTKGESIAGATVVVESSLTFGRTISATTRADGSYSIELPKNKTDVWYVHASMVRNYNGKGYTVELHPDKEDDFRGEEGAIRNFTWRLTGAKTTRSGGIYGGKFYFDTWGSIPDYENITVTLTPSGPLIDGSAGSVITRKIASHAIEDIPIGRYIVTASYSNTVQPPTALHVRIAGTANLSSSVTADILPGDGTCSNCAYIDIKP